MSLEDDAPDVGWASSFPVFAASPRDEILGRLRAFVENPGAPQLHAWKDSISPLQREVREVLSTVADAQDYSALLEHRLPLEARRSDAVFLVAGGVIVIELKGKSAPSIADLDQAAAYARDLRAYHRECRGRFVHAVLVPTRYNGPTQCTDGVWVTPFGNLDALVRELSPDPTSQVVSREDFLRLDSYSPLPTLIQAARDLFFSGTLKDVWRAKAATEPAVNCIAKIAHLAAREQTRHLILVSGIPGSGKTLVGMRAVHAHYLDDLAVPRAGGTPLAPALFLSGNGPLVEVLQHVLREPQGQGKTFVKHIKSYLDYYIPKPQRIPEQHLIVFDEAQRAFTPDKVAELHGSWLESRIKSEPALFVELAERVPGWSVIVGLIGTGQEIYVGEEGGIEQWRDALLASTEPSRWTVHAPALLESAFAGSGLRTEWDLSLHLDTELRYHAASYWHELVDALLTSTALSDTIRERSRTRYGLEGFRIRMTRDLDTAKSYLRERYADQPDARFGLLASSRDKLLESYGVPNDFNSTRRVKIGPWFADGSASELSCRHLTSCATEFQAQGLELDMGLVAWGSDFVRHGGKWDSGGGRNYKRGTRVLDPHRLRTNAYRVLLTRGRDGNVLFVPPSQQLDETWAFFHDAGFDELT